MSYKIKVSLHTKGYLPSNYYVVEMWCGYHFNNEDYEIGATSYDKDEYGQAVDRFKESKEYEHIKTLCDYVEIIKWAW